MFAQRIWSGAVRKAFAQMADVVHAVVSVGILSTMLHNWPDPHGHWRHTDVSLFRFDGHPWCVGQPRLLCSLRRLLISAY